MILGGLTIANAGTDLTPTTYISYIDDVLGFYKVRNLEQPPRQFTYNSHTLNINQGDIIIWQNDAEKTTFTILSEQNLWDSNVGYLRVGSKMNYKFDNPGKYIIYMKEHTSIRQTIIVNAIGEVPDETVIPTPVSTTYVTTPIPTVVRPTYIPTPTVTDFNPTINFNISNTGIASIIVALLSIFITYRTGKNK